MHCGTCSVSIGSPCVTPFLARSDCLHPKAGMQKQAMWSNVFVPESSVSQQAVRVPLGVRERIELGEKSTTSIVGLNIVVQCFVLKVQMPVKRSSIFGGKCCKSYT